MNDSPSPVTFNFLPGVDADDIEQVIVDPDGRSIRFGQVKVTANRPFHTETGFQTFNPYSAQYYFS
ncbi:MAG: hypothetical protein ACOC9P_02650 [bacterium]